MVGKKGRYFSGKLNINYQIFLLLLSGTIIPTLIVGVYGILSSSKALFEVAIKEENGNLNKEVEKIKLFLGNRDDDIIILSQMPPVQGIIRARANEGIDPLDQSTYASWKQRMAIIFKATIETRDHYYSLVYVDENGNELVKTISSNFNGDQTSVQVLKNIATETYFQEAMKLNDKETYVSAVSLLRENGQIVEPYQPLIYYATPLFDVAGKRQGIIFASVSVQSFVQLQETTEDDNKVKLFLINQDGYYLHHPDTSKEWGFDLSNQYKVDQEYPNIDIQQIFQKEEGYLDHVNGQLLSFNTVTLEEHQEFQWKIISTIPRKVVFQSVTSLKWALGLIMFFSVVIITTLILSRLQKIRSILNKFIYQVTSASQEILTTVTQQEQVSTQQSIAVNETATTIEELNQSSQQSGQQATNVFQIAQDALDSAELGNRSVGEILASLVEMTEKVEAIAEKIKNLNAQVMQISSISQLVSEIANQTNMLSLNAAVEAVRAGEQGKGFGVVATEIRKLADQSRQSAKDINTLAANIQHEMKLAMKATAEGKQTVEFSMDIAQKTAYSFNAVTESVSDVTYTNQQISLNLQQQAKAIAQVVEAINSINTGSKEAAIGLNQTKLSIEQLNETSTKLTAIL